MFLDSEFTSLAHPELISVGAVATDATAFYAEVRGWSPERSSDFVRRVVLPLLDGDAVTHDVAREAFATWLDERTGRAPTTVISDSGFDRWALAELLGSEDLPPLVSNGSGLRCRTRNSMSPRATWACGATTRSTTPGRCATCC